MLTVPSQGVIEENSKYRSSTHSISHSSIVTLLTIINHFSIKIKTQIPKISKMLALSYGTETWILITFKYVTLAVNEFKVLWQIYGCLPMSDGAYRQTMIDAAKT